MTELYRLRSVTKRYGSNVAVDIDALTIPAGRLYTLTGANGAGKSTLLGILAFLTPPTTGEIFYAGERIDWKSDIVKNRRRKVTLLHQSPYLFRGTVFRNVAYGLQARGVAGEKMLRAVDRALETVVLDRFPAGKRRGWRWRARWRWSRKSSSSMSRWRTSTGKPPYCSKR